MAIAYAPDTHRTAHGEPAPEAPPTRAKPSLAELHESLDIPGYRVEILAGRVVVSPSPVRRHGYIVTWLTDALREVCTRRGLERNGHATVELSATGERIEPDLLVCPENDQAMEEWLYPAREAVLVVEVVSSSSRHDDYEIKRRGCALSAIPLYLVIDPEAAVATLYSDPGEHGYLATATTPIGDPLTLPAPLDATLDTATMPIQRRRAPER